MEKFLVVDGDGEVIDDVATEAAGLEAANELIDNAIESTEDGELIVVGIYKLVKTVTAFKKTTRNVKAVK